MIVMSEALAAFTVGLFSAGHCLGMCAGISTAVSFQGGENKSNIVSLLFYNGGRLFSYAVMGAIASGLVSGVIQISQFAQGLNILRFLAAIMMILLALYIGRFWNGLSFFENIGNKIWRHLSPISAKLLPLKSPMASFPLGLLWGWLPCGLVYSALSWAIASGSWQQGLLIMLAFGAGTLPAMLFVGSFAGKMHKFLNHLIFRLLSCFILMSYGLFTAYMAYIRL